jgi:hypothetical protein
MSPVSRGFHHLQRAQAGQASRVPPGQHVTDGFPVLSAGPTPRTPLAEWTFSVTQGGQTKKSWTWQEFQALPAETVTADIHCVTALTQAVSAHCALAGSPAPARSARCASAVAQPAQGHGDLGMGRHRGEPVRQLGGIGATDRDAATGGEHPEHGAADIGERVSASE